MRLGGYNYNENNKNTGGGAKYIHVKQQKSILFDGVLGPKIQEEKT